MMAFNEKNHLGNLEDLYVRENGVTGARFWVKLVLGIPVSNYRYIRNT